MFSDVVGGATADNSHPPERSPLRQRRGAASQRVSPRLQQRFLLPTLLGSAGKEHTVNTATIVQRDREVRDLNLQIRYS